MDLFILKTDVEKFTSTNKKTLHLIFNTRIIGTFGASMKIIAFFLLILSHLIGVKMKINVCIALLAGIKLVTRSTLQYRKWQLIGLNYGSAAIHCPH